MAVARRCALVLLEDAYVRRDRVALVAFRERTARLVLPPTDRPERVHRALEGLRCGGTTPLAAGLELADRILDRARRSGAPSVLLLVSDGRANVGSRRGEEALQREVAAAARSVARRGDVEVVYLDATEEGGDDRAARRLVGLLEGRRITLWRLLHAGVEPAEAVRRAVT